MIAVCGFEGIYYGMAASGPETLAFPFFTLEYRDGVFARLIPADAKDLGGGLFRRGGKTWELPPGDDCAALAEKTLGGRPLLSLLNRGQNPLIKAGPRLARDGERLMELSVAATEASPAASAVPEGEPGAGPLVMELRFREEAGDPAGAGAQWLPLRGLPRYRLCQNVIYEVIDEETLRELGAFRGGGHNRYTLRGEDIPRFADAHGRLVFQFGDRKLKALLAEKSVFVNASGLSLVLGAVRKQGRDRRYGNDGGPHAAPLLRYAERRYPAEEVSRRMEKEYILLDRQWARREDILAAGIFPFLSYAGGRRIEAIKLKPDELIRRGGERLAGGRFAGLFSALEADTGLWLERGSKAEIFQAHLEFLRAWGLSGGAVIKGHREQTACLVSLLKRLASSVTGNTTAFMERRYYELYLPSFLPELKAAHITLPGGEMKSGGASVRIAFYGNPSLISGDPRNASAILVLVEPEEVLSHAETFAHLQNLKTEMTWGIFTDAGELFRGPGAAKLRNLFGIPEAELAPYLIRDAERALKLPSFEFPPPRILRPPALPAEQNLFRYAVDTKFAGLSGPALYSELALFHTGGDPAPFVPLRLLKGSLDIERMDDAERAFFVYWRGEFRRGNIIKTAASYIRVYARELCLFSDGETGASGNFRELFKLWESYRDIFDSINGFLPRWLVDFAVVYEITDNAIPLLVPYTRQCNDPLLTDHYLHQRFINENNSVDFGDIALLIPEVISGSVFFNQEPSSGDPHIAAGRHRLIKDFETVVNAVDRCLRERFRLKLFEFFYPQVYDTEKREAFADMERSGHSSYSITGIRFSKHPPLLDFLENLFRYTEYCFRLKNGLAIKGKSPPLGEAWKQIADSALGPEDKDLLPLAALPAEPVFSVTGVSALSASAALTPPHSITLRESRIEKLRADSDVVRDLLMIEDASEARENKQRDKPRIKTPQKPDKTSLKDYINALNATEREALRIIAGTGKTALADFARKSNTMPEPLIDRINAVFLEQFGDLLVDMVDEKPLIQSEYRKALETLLKTGNEVS